jgi:hypothetical protein
MKSNPDAVIRAALHEEDRRRFSPEAQAFIETRITLEGRVQAWGGLSDGTGTRFLMPPRGVAPQDYKNLVEVHFSPDDLRRFEGASIRVEGVRIEEHVAVAFADETEGLNQDVLERCDQFAAEPTEERLQALLESARARQERVRGLASSNPLGLLRSALRPEDRARFPEAAGPFLEEWVTLVGDLRVSIADNEGGYSSTFHSLCVDDPESLQAGRDRCLSVRFLPRAPQAHSAPLLRVRGLQVDGVLLVPLDRKDAVEGVWEPPPPPQGADSTFFTKALSNDLEPVRYRAAFALFGESRQHELPEVAIPALRKAARDRSRRVRYAVALALSATGNLPSPSVEVLEGALTAPKETRDETIRALARTRSGADLVRPILLRALDGRDAFYPVQALMAFAEMPVPLPTDLLPIVIKQLSSENEAVRDSAALLLARFGPAATQAIPALRALFGFGAREN